MRLHGNPVGPEFSFTFDGRHVPALPGETIGAALSAAGILTLRQTRDGARRGLWCGMGACWDCLVTVDGAPVRACMTKAAPGLDAASGPALHPPPRPTGRSLERRCDVLVVGGGPAGLAAATAAAQAGAGVVLLDERSSAGGQYYKQLAPSHHPRRPDLQHRRGDRLRAGLAGAEILQDVLVWGGFAVDEIAAIVAGDAVVFRPRRLVVAPGAHERPVPIPGWTLPGAMTVGALQGLVRSHRVSPGRTVVLAGNGPLLLQVACELLDAGGSVAAVVEAAAEPGASLSVLGLAAASPFLAAAGLRHLRRLRRAGVPVLWDSTPLAWDGTSLHIRTPGGEVAIPAGACALNQGFVGETGLARALGATHRMSARAPGVIETVTDEDGRTDVPGLFVVGDGASLGGAKAALAQGRLAGAAAAADLGRTPPSVMRARRQLRRARAFQRTLWTLYAAAPLDPADIPDAVVVCRCEDVTAGGVRAAIADGARSLPSVKRATRAGMGRCQGRMCATTLHGLCGGDGEAGHSAPRAPLRPVPLAALMFPAEAEDAYVAAPAPLRWSTASPGPNPGDCDVLVIGGGIVGLSAALFLAQEGRDVVVADRGEPGLAASTANAGSLHVQLVPYVFTDGNPGPIGEALMLGPRSIALWRSFAQQSGETLGIRTEGGLALAATEADLALLSRKAAFERSRGIETVIVDAAELSRLAPGIAPGYLGAAYCAAEGQGDPLRGTLAIAALAWKAGVRPARGIAVLGMERDGPGWLVQTSAGPIRAGQVLNAAGAHAKAIGAMTGLDLPFRGVVQQVIATVPCAPVLRQLVSQVGQHLSLKQTDGGHMLIGGGWPGTYECGATRLLRRSIEGNAWTAAQCVPALAGLDIVRAWNGLAVHADRGPVIGESQPGLFHAVTSNGYTLGPIAGRLVADAMLGLGKPPAHFSPV